MLKITLASGQVQEVPFTQASTLTVTNQGFVDGVATPITASFSEIEDLEITADPVVVQPDLPSQNPPEPPAPTSGLPVDTNAGTEPTDGTPVQDGSTQVDAEGNPAPADSSAPPEALGTVIANAGAVVDAAVQDPAAHIDHLAQAQTDVTAALNTWPDDPNLLDLKTQLDDLAADAAEATPPA